jgi:hypothetical protein
MAWGQSAPGRPDRRGERRDPMVLETRAVTGRLSEPGAPPTRHEALRPQILRAAYTPTCDATPRGSSRTHPLSRRRFRTARIAGRTDGRSWRLWWAGDDHLRFESGRRDGEGVSVRAGPAWWTLEPSGRGPHERRRTRVPLGDAARVRAAPPGRSSPARCWRSSGRIGWRDGPR